MLTVNRLLNGRNTCMQVTVRQPYDPIFVTESTRSLGTELELGYSSTNMEGYKHRPVILPFTTQLRFQESGYDNNFTETPPDDLTCLICHNVARDPQQITCCGKLYCKACLQRSNTCPTCKKRISSYADIVSSQRIKVLKLTCDNEADGCTWSGKLDELEDHLTTCEKAKVACTNGCDDEVQRCEMDEHLETECSLRLHKCPHCSKEGTYKDIEDSHTDECPMIEITCPNEGCKFTGRRVIVGYHRASCPKEPAHCDHEEVGCDVAVTRETLEQHHALYVEQHLKLAMDKIAVQQSHFQTPPRVFKMPHFQQHKQSNSTWESPPFYSHIGGYKMIISIKTSRRSTHLLVYAHLVVGENDHHLVWPFRGVVTIELLNQEGDNSHITQTIRYPDDLNSVYNKRPMDCPGNKTKGRGVGEFIDLPQESEYLEDNCLYFRVSSVKVSETNKPWLTPTDCTKDCTPS